MKDKKSFMILILLSALVGSVYFIFQQQNRFNRIINSIPFLLKGEEINWFVLIGEDSDRIQLDDLKESEKMNILLIFSQPCTPCEKNIIFWNKMSRILKSKVNIYGIILDSPEEAFNFAHNRKLDFKIFVPENIDKFKDALRLKLNWSQTLVLNKNRVFFLYLQDLDNKNVLEILKLIRS